ncbi:MAG: hypothetical protein IJX06_04390 [Clostridia bacterium]|nr:hypothetical protein [Clostridia bacterium]
MRINFIKKNSTTLIGLTTGLIALLCAVFLPAAASGMVISSLSDAWTYVTIIGLAFGDADLFDFLMRLTGPNKGQHHIKATHHIYGGMSIFALVSVLLLVASITLLVISLFTKKKVLDLIGAICFVFAGSYIFHILKFGTNIYDMFAYNGFISMNIKTFKEFYREFKIDIGTLIYALATIFGGAIGILDFFKKPNDATLPPKQVCAPTKPIKTNLSAIILSIVGLIALLSTIVLPGIIQCRGEYTTTLWGLIFGNASFSNGTYITGGLSTFGLISFIVLCVGIGFAVTSFFIKGKNLEFIGAICITVAGFLMLFVMEVGTDILTEIHSDGSVHTKPQKFHRFYLYFQYYIGAIICVFVAILGGAMGIANKFKKLY